MYINANVATERIDDIDTSAIRNFHQALPNYAPTPLVTLPELAYELGIRAVFVKDESNRFGLPSFKVLGASWGCFCALTRHLGLPASADLLEVSAKAVSSKLSLVAATEGNHGRAVAFMARVLRIPARIHVPYSMNAQTRDLIASEGAFIVRSRGDYDDAVREAYSHAEESSGALFIQDTAFEGYTDVPRWIVQGYSTMLKEIDEQLAQIGVKADLMVSPVGVGSLAHAVVQHCKSRKKPVRVATVEPESAPCLLRSLQAGAPVTVKTNETIMDGMNCGTVSMTAWADLHHLVDVAVTVSSYESHEAVDFLAGEHILTGPCGGASLAALRRLQAQPTTSSLLGEASVVVLLSTEGSREYLAPSK
ncbi:Uncharacterized protein PECH_004692 [Penicillium ucsense]|uniref:Tryptophan synthase beta chain-like PALP domain-containing protein n=1 Tax=Penicillium ucsense TaxID=2839758 RepID=A0A8J8WLN8_9EURO|nr:Uncharacterized protein PECM_003448 [Penicillium ucsense]KAF7736886.1 Uncharacterized protein PECH_004692 [Penicillium ucsense]